MVLSLVLKNAILNPDAMSCAILSLHAVCAASNFTTHSICSKGVWVMELIFVLLPALVHLQCDTENCEILHLFTWAQAI